MRLRDCVRSQDVVNGECVYKVPKGQPKLTTPGLTESGVSPVTTRTAIQHNLISDDVFLREIPRGRLPGLRGPDILPHHVRFLSSSCPFMLAQFLKNRSRSGKKRMISYEKC